MCLAIPAKIETIEGTKAEVDIRGLKRKIGLQLMPDAKVGEFVLVHAGFAIQRIDPEEAEETYQLLEDTGITIS
ncbi:MAG: hydrogenase assembly protein HypC [Candidatus Edwardsbacteria bacterium RIFOXYD12_FULL_50_11]|uniref:Hydrogenase assembly protein HypC n=1 Tax=Candidatus Edwardsbacteria bacterium GWF2_54_11 TaxID=1817851 RepID=A0A1F5R7F6_9BACT|nr:HypC/HybG/HupF family hydrogenase formation chaperone [Candidatus Edwardsbacteria bacterium]OGF05022.1 MAG: hydrogenase assembly protein HypC [Candidatus Edwardsbacteria bacterium RifOxyC12_full_54_24]OGF08343.1 MAG: hydrogenase assembly protein HypC [Candidatus Edwardsbacteria bacterium RifOxyA12_full_54_48]OGF10390.1 MAG: hydrogenase assembly protein HypC [Candidatus Edwardsbacteria bacterium GWF2_54_11]OGF11641.1 MAG: hydrogenase assembly protein HypC [Candidatus Edwardsbacteria bacterium